MSRISMSTTKISGACMTGACVVAAAALGAVLAPALSYASAPNPGLSAPGAGLRGAPLAGSLAPPQMASATVSPLLDKELAVLTDQGIPPARAWRAIDVQGKVAGADLPEKLQTALGGAYAGVWFEDATAQLHIGLASPASRRTAAEVAARAGLTDEVAFTPVRSAVAQLLATQRRWNRKLARLFAGEEVETGLEMRRNAVAVMLTSAVPSRQVAALKREAAVAPVNVFVSVLAGPRIGTAQAKECSNFPETNCNPSITAGVRIWNKLKCTKADNLKGTLFFKTQKECEEEKVTGSEGEWKRTEALTEKEAEEGIPERCTAGPAAIPLTNKKARVLLTAGHCIESAGGEKVEWLAFTRELAEPTIGKAGRFVNGGLGEEKKGDFGEILIEPTGGWRTGKPGLPVRAVTAEWKKAGETRYRVKGERAPVEGNTNCHEGQTSGEWCGRIKLLSVTVRYRPPAVLNTKEGLVEDEKAVAEGGDSGGPWLFIETNNEALMEGTHAGLRTFGPCHKLIEEGTGPDFFPTRAECEDYKTFKEGNKGFWERLIYTWFEPLKQPVQGAGEGSLEALGLELLTTANERIEPEFAASKFPVKFTASSGESRLETVAGHLVKCKASKGGGEVNSATEFKNALIKFTGCRSPTGESPCKSSGAAAEEIVTNKLKGSPVYLNKSKKEAGLLGEPQEAGGLYAEFKCVNLFTETVKVKGTTLSTLTPVNSSTTLFTSLAKQEKGKPTPSLYENESGEKVKIKTETKGEGFEVFGYEESGLESPQTLTTTEAIEVEA